MGKHLPTLKWEVDKTGKRKSGGRWLYVHQRKNKYFHGGAGKSDRENYRQQQEKCAEWLEQQQTAHPFHDDYVFAIGRRRQMVVWCDLNRDDPDAEVKASLKAELKQLEVAYAKREPLPVAYDPLGDLPAGQAILWLDRLGNVKAHEEWSGNNISAQVTIKHHAEKWLQGQERSAKLPNGIALSTYKTYYERLNYFTDWAGEKPIQALEGQLLKQWQAELEDRIIDKQITSRWAYNVMTVTKRFVKSMYTTAVLEHLPRCFDDAKISPENPKVVVWTKDEVTKFLDNSVDRTRLFALLMLNCGFLPTDIADLRQSEVDWTNGRITRKRKKTKKRKTVPTVTYLLWDETFKLLKQFRSSDPVLALTDANGNPLVKYVQKDDKLFVVNNIDSAFDRVVAKMKWRPAKSLQLLRKTGSNKMKDHQNYRDFRQYFLGQAGKTLADRRYTADGFDEFDRSQIWLGEQFGFKTKRKMARA